MSFVGSKDARKGNGKRFAEEDTRVTGKRERFGVVIGDLGVSAGFRGRERELI